MESAHEALCGIRGNVIAIPIGDTLLYVEPIYLQAETASRSF
jgi:uncharacterized membrane protein (UPF0182 family)